MVKFWFYLFVGLGLANSCWAQNVVVGGTNNAAVGLQNKVTATAASSLLVLGRPGNIYWAGGTVGSGAGFLLGYDALTAPSDGTVSPIWCYPIPASGAYDKTWSPGPPLRVTTGFVIVFSTGANCFTQTKATTFLWGAGQ